MSGRFGYNNNPNCLQFRSALKSILLHNSIKMSFGNCTLLSNQKDSLFAIKWSYKKSEEILRENEFDMSLLIENSNDLLIISEFND